ncbi:unnamed protein product [Meloidogyne enterolobii]|uniref:Uncharacterized protein n=1 Tax=Meloidogyne enterolobii TaxID=390850 RepID=A0ACB0ZN95_MELEN
MRSTRIIQILNQVRGLTSDEAEEVLIRTIEENSREVAELQTQLAKVYLDKALNSKKERRMYLNKALEAVNNSLRIDKTTEALAIKCRVLGHIIMCNGISYDSVQKAIEVKQTMDKLEEMDSQNVELPLIRGLLYYHVSAPNWFLKQLLKRLCGTKLKELISGASYKKSLANLTKYTKDTIEWSYAMANCQRKLKNFDRAAFFYEKMLQMAVKNVFEEVYFC